MSQIKKAVSQSDPLDGSIRNINLPVSQFIYKIKKTLLELKDQIQDRKREDENRQKILLQEGLRLGPGRLKLLELDSRINGLLFKKGTSTFVMSSKRGASPTGATIYL